MLKENISILTSYQFKEIFTDHLESYSWKIAKQRDIEK